MDLLRDVVANLAEKLDGVRVATERPENAPTELVTVARTGGGGDEFAQTARFVIHAWGESEASAYKLGMRAADAMFQLPAFSVNVVDVEQNSFYSNIYTDGTRRWSGAYDIYHNR